MKSLPQDVADSFWADKVRYDSLCQAVKVVSSTGREDLVDQLTPQKTAAKQAYIKALNVLTNLVKVPGSNTNIHHIRDSWYVVRVTTDKNIVGVSVEPFNQRDLYMIERNPSKERDISRAELDTIAPAMLDTEALEEYKIHLRQEANVILESYGIEPSSSGCPVVSVHASRRYVQRILGIKNEALAEEHRRANSLTISEEVLKGFNSAQLIWEGNDGVQYWLDENNIVYVYTDFTVVTLYEEDFGFDKAINRMVTFAQIEVLNKVYKELYDSEQEYAQKIDSADAEAQNITDQIQVLEAELSKLQARKNLLLATKEEAGKSVNAIRARYNAEFNKLFKKWEGTDGNI